MKIEPNSPVGKKFIKKVVVAITPPIILSGIHYFLDRFSKRSAQSLAAKYSTVDNPLEVPGELEAYLFCRDTYLEPGNRVLDVGFGLGYGMQVMASRVNDLVGIEVDSRAAERAGRVFAGHPWIKTGLYDGRKIPFTDKSFDVVTCLEVLEHVEDYPGLIREMVRVARRLVFITTPNRRPEYTLRNGRPMNYWHLREWTESGLKMVFDGLGCTNVEWNFLNGPFEGPFFWTKTITADTLSLVPVIMIE